MMAPYFPRFILLAPAHATKSILVSNNHIESRLLAAPGVDRKPEAIGNIWADKFIEKKVIYPGVIIVC